MEVKVYGSSFDEEAVEQEYGRMVGYMHPSGDAGHMYIIRTDNGYGQPLSMDKVGKRIDKFLDHVKNHPNDLFDMTDVKNIFNKLPMKEVMPLFKNAPANCITPHGWKNPTVNIGKDLVKSKHHEHGGLEL